MRTAAPGRYRDAHSSHRSTRHSLLRAVIAFIAVNSLLILPMTVNGYPPLPRLSVEAVVLLGVMLLASPLGGRLRLALAAILAAAITVVLLLKAAVLAVRLALDRPLNVALDWVMLSSVVDLSIGTFGTMTGTALIVLGLVAVAGVWWLLAWSLHVMGGLSSLMANPARVFAGVLLIGLGAGLSAYVWPGWTKGTLAGIGNRLVVEQSRMVTKTRRQQELFREELANEDLAADEQSIPALEGVDVIVAFVESYGMSALSDERFAPVIVPRLRSIENDLDAAGVASVSAWLESPTAGGQSWLAHASVLSGLRVDNNANYQALATSDRTTLIDLFENTGHRSIAVMPALLWPWPEGEAFGYDAIYKAEDLGYEASPFNWVTMPDQFTLSAFERLERKQPRGERDPVFAHLALISSHAPWTPIAEVVPWSSIDDEGLVFDTMAQRGPSPADVWSDPALIRQHFALALDYVIAALGSYAARYVDDGTLLIVMGDHQPAPIVTGPNAGQTVPVHIIASNRDLLEPFLDAGFHQGLRPSENAMRLPMAAMRNLIVRGFNGLDG